ncbi:5588_t:CDS:2, partial [Ambispora leptoticha]
MDPSAALLSLLHQPSSSADSSLAGQRSPTAFSPHNSQSTTTVQSNPLPQQNSTVSSSTSTALSLFSMPQYPLHTSQQQQQYNGFMSSMVLPATTGVPPAPPPPPTQQIGGSSTPSQLTQSLVTPPPDPLTTLFQSLHSQPIPMAPPPPPIPKSVITQAEVQETRASSESDSPTTSVHINGDTSNGNPTFTIDKEPSSSFSSLKLPFFGFNPSGSNINEEETQVQTERIDSTSTPLVSSVVQNTNQSELENNKLSPPEKSNVDRINTPVEVIDYNNLSAHVMKSSSAKSTPPPEKQLSSPVTKSMFTYTNPFDLLKNSSPSPPPNREFNHIQLTSNTQTSPTQKKREITSHAKEGGMFSRPLHQIEPFLSGLSAWNVRATSAPKNDLSPPDGVRLPPGDILYSAAERNEAVLCTKDLNTETITLIPSDLEYRVGKSIAVNGQYICYTVKAGKVRVISSLYGSKTLLRKHEKPIVDISIQNSYIPDIDAPVDKQLLLVIGSDSKITVWELSDAPQEQNAEIPSKTILEIDGKDLTDDNHCRYLRAIWHTVNRNMFAVATNTNDVLIIDINKLLDGAESGSFKEHEISEKILKTDPHEETINDMTFSFDGTILVTASHENIMFSELEINSDNIVEGIGPAHRIILSGEQCSSVFLVNPQDLSPEATIPPLKCNYAIIGTERNTTIHLYDVIEGQTVQTIKFLPPPARRPSLNKAYRKEDDMFNCIDYDQRTRTLVLANSARISIITLHLNIPQGKVDTYHISPEQTNIGIPGVIETEQTDSLEDSSFNSPQFDYLIEFPVNQLVGSFVLVSDPSSGSHESEGLSFYCIQSKAVQQYYIAKELLYPSNIDHCPIFESTTRSIGQVEQDDRIVTHLDERGDFKKEEPEKNVSKSSVKSENSQYSNNEENLTEKDNFKETVVATGTETASIDVIANTETVTVETETTEKVENASGNNNESVISSNIVVVSEETEGRGLDQNNNNNKVDTTSGIKLSGTAVNGAISKIKRKGLPSSSNQTEPLSDPEKSSRRKESRRAMEREGGIEGETT